MQTLKARGLNEAERVLWMALFTPGVDGRIGLPYLLVGAPGGAKTGTCKTLAKRAGLGYEAILGSVRAPTDYLGVPFLRKAQIVNDDCEAVDVEYTHYAPPGWAIRMAQAPKGALVNFDELNTASLSVQAAMLRVLFEGVVGEFQLPSRVRMIACMNPVSSAAGGRELSKPLQNRVGMLDWHMPDVKEFTAYHLGTRAEQEVDPLDEQGSLHALWAQTWPVAFGAVSGFLNARPELLHKEPPKAGTPWPSHRTWEFAMRAYAGSLAYGLSDKERALAMSAYVGKGTYAEFHTWTKSADLPDPAALLDGQEHFEHVPARIDRTAAVLGACTALVTPAGAEKRKERVSALWRLLKDIPDSALDICVPTVDALQAAKLHVGNTTAWAAIARLEPVMTAAGVIKS